MKILAFSDVHLRPDRLADQEQVLARIADLAEEREVDAVLFAGDLFEGPLVTPEEYRLARLALTRFGVPVIAINGNGRHDLATRDVTAIEIAKDARVHVYTDPTVDNLNGFSVACLPWTPVGPLVASHGGGDRDRIHEHAADLLIEIARGLRADIPAGVPAILLLHWSISGASLPNGLAIDEHAREPILPLADLDSLGFDAVIAGHIHKPQSMTPWRESRPVLYCGSPLPLSFGEADTQHGVWILDIEEDGVRPEFVEIESRPFVTLDYDLTVTA